MVFKAKLTILSKRYRKQLFAAFIAHILTLAHGIGTGWLSPTLHLLQSNQSPLDFIVTVDEASWIGSLFGLGALLGNIIFGFTVERWGRKLSMYLIALPHMHFWILNYIVQSVWYLYAARFLAGVTSGGLYVVIPIFISEISDANIRGALSSMTMLVLSCGILVGSLTATYLDFFVIPIIMVTFPILYLVGCYFLPETPQYLLKLECDDAAQIAYNFYKNNDKSIRPYSDKGCSGKAFETNAEFEALKAALLQSNVNVRVTLKDFFNKSTIHTLGTAFILAVLNQFSGNFAALNYMSLIFAKAGSNWLHPNSCTIVMGVIQIAGAFAATILVDRYGRKPLLLSSAGGMTLGMCSFGAFIQLSDEASKVRYNWLPLVFMAIVVFTAAFGVFSLVFTIIVEILPAKIRSQGQAICMIFNSCLVFASLGLYPYFLHQLGIAATMYICSSVCISTSIYLLIFLPETKGKVMERD